MTDLMTVTQGVRRWRDLTECAEKDIDLDSAPVVRHNPWHDTHHCDEEAILLRALHRFGGEREARNVILGRLLRVRQALAEIESQR